MAVEYPDVIGEYVSSPQRFEVNGLQYAGLFEPAAIQTGDVTQFQLILQSTINKPLSANIKLDLPLSGRFRGHPILKTNKTEFVVDLAEAEVGRLVVPLAADGKPVDGEFNLGVEVKVQQEKGADRIRSSRSKPVKIPHIDNMTGLDLIGILGTHYKTKNGKKSSFTVQLSKAEVEPGEAPNLAPDYQAIWTLEYAELMRQAQMKVNDTRIKIIDDLKVEPLFAALFSESAERFADAGLPLRVGEAIAVAKLLTYTVHFFLGQEALQNGLLCPIWMRAMVNDMAGAHTLEVIKYAGYKHIVRLASALSFGLIAENVGQQLWSQHERTEVSTYIAEALDEGATLPAGLLYLPLMLGALRVVKKVHLPDEDIEHTLRLIHTARQERPDVFVDEDMAQANQVFNHLLNSASTA